ncbi:MULTISPECIES: IclR family transcriptional regulator [unclassified Gordonia (in: high G+C Gram-positive bacteria)]|uniref:IclR family transcriptional regulator n=1 Tax=unclassified Gordonia (in: high G+C Gram-positive bacteria) TaxID=2657482 RepID=UPI0008161FB8|nr:MULTISPECIES: IclR family transcriptional regulator [unclassified Gordonia (in: high G+C Gram-positive bacteria)]SCC04704.1 transcriptional regulator, IclR family [Gordonia sp. v-85]
MSTDSVQVLAKMMRILDCFTPDQPRMTVAEIKRITDLPTTTTARLVKTLVDHDLLRRAGDQYSIGLRSLSWTAAATAGSELLEAVGPVLTELRDLSGETSGAYVRRGNSRVAVAVELSQRSVVYQARVGQVMPMHAGAAGKVFMAFDDDVFRAAVAQEGPDAGGALAELGSLRGELDHIRAQGWAYTQGEREVGLNSMAVPVRDASGLVIATLAVGGPSFRLTPDVAERIGPEMSLAAARLSRRLGWRELESASPERFAPNAL